jgi:uncharacterized membrane protein YfhO
MKVVAKSKNQPVKTSKPKNKDKVFVAKPFTLNYVEQYPFLIFFGLLLFIGIFIFRDFLFFNKLYLFKDIGSDTINTFYPTFVFRSEMNDLAYNYTFRRGMGAPTIGTFDPPYSLFYYLNKENIALLLGWGEFLTIILTGIVFYFYLRTISIGKYASIMGALFFAYSGFMIGGSGWYQHTYQLFCLSILLFSFEQALVKNRYLPFLLCLTFVIKSLNLFYVYFFGMFLVIYAVFRIIDQKEDFKKTIKFAGVLVGVGLIACLINIGNIISNIESIFNLSRVSGNLSKADQMQNLSVFATGDYLHNVTAALRFFSNDILGTGKISELIVDGKRALISDYKGFNNYYEAPMFYIGLIPLLIFPQIILHSTKRQRILYLSFLLIWLFPVIFPFFRRAYFLFFGDYYRVFSIFLPFAILYLALKGLDDVVNKAKMNTYLLLGSLVFLLILIHFPYFDNETLTKYNLNENPINNQVKTIVSFFLIAFTLLFIWISKTENKSYGFIFIAILSVLELTYLSNITVNQRDHISAREFKSKVGFNDYTVDAVSLLKEKDKTFYRLEKDYASGTAIHGSLNDAMIQGYFGTSSYSSEQQPNYIRFLQQNSLLPKGDELAARWSGGVRNRPLLAVLCNIKYMLSKSENPVILQFGYSLFDKKGDVYIYKNNYSLPMGFTYSKFIKESVFDSLSMLQKDIAMLNAAVVADSLVQDFKMLKEYNASDTLAGYSVERLKADTDSLKKDSINITHFTEDEFKGEISLTKPKVLYFSILYDNAWVLKINGKDYPKYLVNNGFTGIMLDKGDYKIELSYKKSHDGLFFRIADIISNLAFLVIIFFIIWNMLKAKKKQSLEF